MILICGEGLSQTSRCLALGKELLTAGYEVYFGTYGYSKKMVEKNGIIGSNTESIHLIDNFFTLFISEQTQKYNIMSLNIKFEILS